MIEEKVTYVIIGKDSGAVTHLGDHPCPFNSELTMKLAHLPAWYTPLDVLELFQTIPAPNGEASVHSISMPLSTATKRRLPEAFVYFSTAAQRERVINRVFQIEGKDTEWTEATQRTCRTCGSPNHGQPACEVLQLRKKLQAARKANTMAIRGITTSPSK
ncbi:hypothetical protein BGZ54_005849, partial [Gamsiella multidivaricata]